jgi:dihydroflavonol-4-reductase
LTKLYPSGGILVSDAEDVARAHLYAMEKGIPGERYIVGTENTKYHLLLDLLYNITGFHPVSIPMPHVSALLMGWLSDLFARMFRRAVPSIPSLSVVKRTYLDLFLSSEKATLQLGMTWTPLKATLDKTVDWLRKNRLI